VQDFHHQSQPFFPSYLPNVTPSREEIHCFIHRTGLHSHAARWLFTRRFESNEPGAFWEFALHFLLPDSRFPLAPFSLRLFGDEPRAINATLTYQVKGIGARGQFELWYFRFRGVTSCLLRVSRNRNVHVNAHRKRLLSVAKRRL
jgi:hypothetical protein